jgi:thiol-disulfide isomerase/thioredoxin
VFIFLLLVLAAGALPAWCAYTKIILRDMEATRVDVDSLLTTGPVVLNFWATWCRPCRVEMPHLETIQKELEPKGVHFAAVSLDTRNRKSSVEAYIKKEKVTLPVYRDPEGTLAKRFQVKAIPTTIVLDQNAEIHYRTKGYRRGDEILLKKKIEALIRPEGMEVAPEKSNE